MIIDYNNSPKFILNNIVVSKHIGNTYDRPCAIEKYYEEKK